MVDTISTGGTSTTAGLAQLIASLAPILLGSGTTTANQSGTSTVANTGGNTSTVTSGAPDLTALQEIFTQAKANSTNDAATSAIVKNILDQAALAFGPTRAAGNSAGLYDSTVVTQMANEAQALATQQAAKTVLDYKTAQQTIAENSASLIGQLTASTAPKTTTGTNNTAAVTTPKTTTTQSTASSVPGGQKLLAGTAGGLAGYSALGNLGLTDKLSSLLGKGTDLSGADLSAAQTAEAALGAEPSSIPLADPAMAQAAIGTLPTTGPLAATLDPAYVGYGDAAAVADTASTATEGMLTSDLTDIIPTSLGEDVGSAASSVVDASSAVDATDALSSLGDTLSTGFSDIGNFFASLF